MNSPQRGPRSGSRATGVLARRRRELIADHVRRNGSVRVSELTVELGVSDMTIRRDLEALTAAGIVAKVHGGATLANDAAATSEPGFAAKSSEQLAEKRAIARAAARLVRPGSAIGLLAGTTTWQFATELRDVAELTVVTNSMRIADALLADERPDRTVMLTGGVRTPSDALVGPLAVQAVRSLHLDQVFMGTHGMNERVGFTTPNLLEAETNRAFIASARELIALADHTKWNIVGLATIAPLSAAAVVVTDGGLADDDLATLREHIGRVIQVDEGATDPDDVEARR